MTEVVDPQLAHYSNRDLEGLLANPRISEDQKNQLRQELTRRMRDDLVRSAQAVEQTKTVQRRKRAWKLGKVYVLLIVLLICAITMLCALLVIEPQWFHRIFGFIPALFAARGILVGVFP